MLMIGYYAPGSEVTGNETVDGNFTVGGQAQIKGGLVANAVGASLGAITGSSGALLIAGLAVQAASIPTLDANFTVSCTDRNASKWSNGLNLGHSSSEYPSIGYAVRYQTSAGELYDKGDVASRIKFQAGGFFFDVNNTVGTIGNPITWTTALNISATGGATFGGPLNVAGTLGFTGYLTNGSSGNEVTGAGTALLSTNCPAVTVNAPFKWLTVKCSDGSTGYIPIWK